VEDIEWRVSLSGQGQGGIFCLVLAYITARAIQKRLDDVCGVEGWKVEAPRIIDVNGKSAFAVGISIRMDLGEWIEKWDVSEPTNIEPAKGGFSGAMKRSGAQWGIGRYLYYLDETFAEVSEQKPVGRKWNYARLSDKHGGREFWWKAPNLPAWALPKDLDEHEVTLAQLNDLKRLWRDKFGESLAPDELRQGFARFVASVAGEFPVNDYTCWTTHALERCEKRIKETTDPKGVDSDVPFEE
jgi:hypothetical protein